MTEDWVVELILAIDRIRDAPVGGGHLANAVRAAGELADEAAQLFTLPERKTVTRHNGR